MAHGFAALAAARAPDGLDAAGALAVLQAREAGAP
jgi:hypothetical protein